MKQSIFRSLHSCGRGGQAVATRASSSNSALLHPELISRRLPLMFDYLYPQQSHLLNLTLCDLLSEIGTLPQTHSKLPSISRSAHLPPGHHLVYFPPQVSLSQLLPDGTDTLHTPGPPFNRRLWAGGRVRFSNTNRLILDGSRAVCIEGIRDVIVKDHAGEEKIIVKIERQIGTVPEEEDEDSTRDRIWKDSDDVGGCAPAVIENRDLVFMRGKTAEQLDHDRSGFHLNPRTLKSPTDPEFRHKITPTKALLFRFSALTLNAHSIHLDKDYTQNTEGYRNLLVHGPLTLTLLLTVLQDHLAQRGLTIKEIEYKNLTPLFVEEELAICGKPKQGRGNAVWDVWIDGRDGGLAVRGTVHTGSAQGVDDMI